MKKERTTKNPVLNRQWEEYKGTGDTNPMTQKGAFGKTAFLFLLMVAGFILSAYNLLGMGVGLTKTAYYLLLGIILAVVIIACVAPKLSPVLAPLYALLEGTILGSVIVYSDYVLEAFVITAAIFFTLLFLYQTRIIRVSNGFVKLIVGLTMGIAVFYLLELVFILLGITSGGLVFGNGIIGLLIAGFCLFVAVSNLLVDFRTIENGANLRLPKYMEWYFGMSLMISIVWVYMEVLRILSIFSRD